MKRVSVTVLALLIAMVSINIGSSVISVAGEDVQYLIYEQNMEEGQTIKDVLPTINKKVTDAGYVLEKDSADTNNTVLALIGSAGRFEIQPPKPATGSKITLEYRFKFREGTTAKAFELMRAFATTATNTHMVYNSYNNAFYYRYDGGNASTGKKANPGTWYRYVVTLKNLNSSKASDKVYDHTIYEQDPSGSEKVLFTTSNRPIMQQSNEAQVLLLNQFHRFWIDSSNLDNLIFDDFRVYSNNINDLTEEYKARNDRTVLEIGDITDELPEWITTDVRLPNKGQMGSNIRWTSSDPDVINPGTGAVIRQMDTTDVTLTAHVSYEGVDKEFKKEFVFSVIADDRTDEEVVAERANVLKLENTDKIISDFSLPDTVGYRTEVKWSSDDDSIVKISGHGAIITRHAEDASVTLHAVVSRGSASVTRNITVTVLKEGMEQDVSKPYETLEAYDDNAVDLKGWTLNNAEKVTEDGCGVLRLQNPDGTGNSSAKLDFPEYPDDKSFDIRLKSTVENAGILAVKNVNDDVISFSERDGNLIADICGTEKNLGICPDEWFTIKVNLDHKAKTVNILVNGENKTGNVAVDNAIPSIDELCMEIPVGVSGEIFLDYFKGYGDLFKDLRLSAEQLDFSSVDRNAVKEDFDLPSSGVGNTKIVWKSSNPSIIDISGNIACVTRPDPEYTDAKVTLTAELSNSLAKIEVPYEFVVSRNMFDDEVIALEFAEITLPESISTSNTRQIYLPAEGKYGSDIKWESSNPDVIGNDGKVYSIGYDGNEVENVTMKLTVKYGKSSQEKSFNISVNRVNMAYDSYITGTSSLPGHSVLNAVDNDLNTAWVAKAEETRPALHIALTDTVTFNQIVLKGYEQSTKKAKIEYSADDIEWYPLCNADGLSEKQERFEFAPVTAKYIRYTVTDKTLGEAGLYEMLIYYNEKSENTLEKAVNAVTIANSGNIKSDFTLPAPNDKNVRFEWTSEDSNIIKLSDGKAHINRPYNDTNVTLTLKAYLGSEMRTKHITVTVKGSKTSDSGAGGGGGGSKSGNKSAVAGFVDTAPVKNNVQTPVKKNFDDVDNSHWAKAYIDSVFNSGIMTGKSNRKFEPDTNIRRDEFVKVLILGFGFDLVNDSGEQLFDDIERNSWSHQYILTAKKLGIINGIDGNTFGADMNISREDMSVMIVRAANAKGWKWNLSGNSVQFDDESDISDYAKDSVGILTEAAILSGMGANKFAPKQTATRAEVAKIIYMIRMH